MKKGNKYMNKDGVNKVVAPELFDLFLADGWVFGNTNAATNSGKHFSDFGYHYYNNGLIEVKKKECPDGFIPGRLPFSVETKLKIGLKNSEALKGKIQSEETKLKRSNSLKGHFVSQLTREKLSNSLKGKQKERGKYHWYTNGVSNVLSVSCPIGFYLGFTVSDDTKEKISKSLTGIKRSKDQLDKAKETNIEKYGVEYPFFLGQKNGHRKDSTFNKAFELLLINNNINYQREFRVDSYFYDFKIDKYLIEIDPYATHNVNWNPFSGKPIDKNYHLNKSLTARNNNYLCIHIFDWDDTNKIIKLLIDRLTIYARNCCIKQINSNLAKEFLNNNHLLGYCKSSIKYGLFYNNILVSVMTFGKPRYNKNYQYELLRYCSIYNVIGGALKLFKHFIKDYNPQSIISYCDLSKFNGNTYLKLNFKLYDDFIPSKHWYNYKLNKHITDNLLRQRGFDQLFNTNYGKGTSNELLMLDNGFVEIYDCGQLKFVWLNKGNL